MAVKRRKNDNIKKENKTEKEEEVKNNAPQENKPIMNDTIKMILKIVSVFLLLSIYSNLYLNKAVPYQEENKVLREVLKDPELIKYTYEYMKDFEEGYNKYAKENDIKDFLSKIPKYIPESSTTTSTTETATTTTASSETSEKVKDSDISPEEDNAEVIGDMKESVTGGEIYTISEAFEKLGIKRISEYKSASEYENQLLKEFKMDREPPENIAKKTDYYSQIIERGLKKDERFFVKKINDKKNYGLFANVDIMANEVLGIYTGIIQEATSEKGGKYEWYYSTIPDRKKEKMVELRVNAKKEGSHLRFVNHSKFYNARLEYVPYNNMWYILFVSNRFITKGEEITVNYREKTKRMPEKIIDKWEKVEMEEYQKLYDEYMKLYNEYNKDKPQGEEKKNEPTATDEPPKNDEL